MANEQLFYLPLVFDDNIYRNVDFTNLNDLESIDSDFFGSYLRRKYKNSEEVVLIHDKKYLSKIFIPVDKDDIEYAYCLVDSNLVPFDRENIEYSARDKNQLKSRIEQKCYYSEGILPRQSINLEAQYVLPKLRKKKNNKVINEFLFSVSEFKKDTVLIGVPGSGKTSALRRLTLELSRINFYEDTKIDRIPIYLQLRSIDENMSFNTFISNHFNSIIDDNQNDIFIKFCGEGRMVLLFDGLDELSFNSQHEFVKWILGFKSKYPLIQVIISTRPTSLSSILEDFEKIEICPFDSDQVTEFTYRKFYFNNIWKQYLSSAKSSPDIQELIKNPLLLSISQFLFEQKTVLPVNIAQLIKEFVEILTETWDSNRGINRYSKLFTPQRVRNILGIIALKCKEENSHSFTGFDVNKWLHYNEIDETNFLLNRIAETTGLITLIEFDKWEFLHISIENFFCANYLVEGSRGIHDVCFTEDKWQKTLHHICGLSSDPDFLDEKFYQLNASKSKFSFAMNMILQSPLLNENSLKKSITSLDNFFVEKEKRNKISLRREGINNLQFIIHDDDIEDTSEILIGLLDTRWTIYHDAISELIQKSNSKSIKALAGLYRNQDVSKIILNDNYIEINLNEESPEVDNY